MRRWGNVSTQIEPMFTDVLDDVHGVSCEQGANWQREKVLLPCDWAQRINTFLVVFRFWCYYTHSKRVLRHASSTPLGLESQSTTLVQTVILHGWPLNLCRHARCPEGEPCWLQFSSGAIRSFALWILVKCPDGFQMYCHEIWLSRCPPLGELKTLEIPLTFHLGPLWSQNFISHQPLLYFGLTAHWYLGALSKLQPIQ